ncbi:MAG: hypothetical protein COW59_00705 [Lysobacterales bacterium CG17_big_fil_post_rev_8_21_14_2_50_64_11]|nr:MAG: hypothetical protein COW59_00705 [Xanthomonadales bacterium CG17_big_fil_post_rev_8_21_14_2_50_64_11]PIX59331.1 MAG: DUF3501 domain-containing protein [Xanthomonadales bacterium CG_4_10_14_3_um_filter_64_11]
MNALSRTELYTLEAYASARAAFRATVIAHKKNRQVPLGEHITLLFEDRLTIQYQVQEMLRIERIFEPEAIQDELDTYNALIPTGSNLKATMLIEFPDEAQRRIELARLGDIEHKVYAEVEGLGRAFAIADEDMQRSNSEKTAAVHFLRFEFSAEQIAALRAGAEFGFGIDDERLRVGHTLKRDTRAALLADFG